MHSKLAKMFFDTIGGVDVKNEILKRLETSHNRQPSRLSNYVPNQNTVGNDRDFSKIGPTINYYK